MPLYYTLLLSYKLRCIRLVRFDEQVLIITIIISTDIDKAGNVLTLKIKAIPVQVWTGPEDSRRLRLPEVVGKQHMKVVSMSALRTGRLYTPGNLPGTHFCYRLSRPQGHSAAGRIISM